MKLSIALSALLITGFVAASIRRGTLMSRGGPVDRVGRR
jgi:hypothetical protein